MRPHTLIAYAALCVAATLQAQSVAPHPCNDNSDGHSFMTHFFGGDQICEVRSSTFPLAGGHLNVRGQNGGIDVIGEDRQDIALEVSLTARAGSQSEAASILHEINIETGATVEAHGPKTFGNRNWSASYKLHVPHRLAIELHTLNGGIALTALNGSIRGETTNGSVHIENLAGDVHLTTTNGGIHADLEGPTWQGSGLSATTTNGAVKVSVPSHYSAHLVASTTNGRTSLELPVTEQSGVHRHSIDTNLGSGGPTVSFETTNGSISIQ